MKSMVSLKNVTKTFGEFKAVDNLSFDVKQGEVLGFLGPNGAGKTTTMRMITGYLTPDSGDIKVCGHDISENPIEVQKNIGYLPEGGPLYNDMTPAEFLQFIARIRGLSGMRYNERIEYVVNKLNIKPILNKPIENLSKGYKRRVALAQAILHDPKVLILDEPTDGLDPNQKYEVRKLIKDIAKEKAIIISTHILEEVEAICSKAVIISSGVIVSEGAPDKIAITSPEHNAVVVGFETDSANKVINEILKVKNVEKVHVEDDKNIIVMPKKNKRILAEVGAAIRNKRVIVEKIYEKKGSLDEAFRKLTKNQKTN